ncbi:MAG: chorismate synthase [Candidatus Sumerlaeia bacterium]
MLRYLTAGESHGPQLTAIVSGVPAGLAVSAADIDRDLKRRQGGYGRGGRMTIERDAVRIVSGVRHGLAMGSPITLVVENRDWKNWQAIMSAEPVEDAEGQRAVTRPRPGHADLAGIQKFGHTDARNILERASARATTTQVAVGAICKALLREFDIRVCSHVVELGDVSVNVEITEQFSHEEFERLVEASELRVADPAAEPAMKEIIDNAKKAGDTVGGIFEVIATGVPAGLGNVMNWDERLDGRIAQAMMALQAIKGVEIGLGFDSARLPGSQVHDPIFYSKDAEDWPVGHGPSGGFYRKTNGAGGIEGGMSNGEPVVVRAAMKPIPTLMRSIESVDFATHEAFDASKERSDVCAVPAAAVIGESLLAIVLAQAMIEKFGGDSVAEMKRNYQGYVKSLG